MKLISARNNQGLSIIELLLGVGIISLVLLSISLMSVRSVQLSELSRNRQKAIDLAKNEIENIRTIRNLSTWRAFRNDLSLYSGSQEIDIYTQTTTLIYEPVEDRVGVTVDVDWIDFKGNHHIQQATWLTSWRQ